MGWVYFLLYLVSVLLLWMYIPPNQLTIHRANARLYTISLPDHKYGFYLKFVSVNSESQRDTYNYLKKSDRYPVVFVHGHKGNVKQAISMAKFYEDNGIYVDMFSVDFKEGAVGLSHNLLDQEAYFLNDALIEIARLYKNKKIGLIVHSMGGVVASLALTFPNAPLEKISFVIALNTPFEAHPVNSYIALPIQYGKIHEFWSKVDGSEIFTVSFTGGVRDLVVPPQLTDIRELMPNNGLHVYSTSINNLNLEIDHIASVWGYEFFLQLKEVMKILMKGGSVQTIKQKVYDAMADDLTRAIYGETSVEASSLDQENRKSYGEGKWIIDIDELVDIEVYDPIDEIALIADNAIDIYYTQDGSLFKLDRKYILLEGDYVYILPHNPSHKYSVKTHTSTNLQIQFISSVPSFSFLQALLLGYNIPVSTSQIYIVKLKPGSSFAQSRYPLKISIQGEGQIYAVHSRCGHEDIIKYKYNDFTLFFHEYCEDGPEIYIVGYDTHHNYVIDIRVDIVGILALFARDFRLYIFSWMGVGLLNDFSKAHILVCFVLLSLAGCHFREFGAFGIDHVHNLHQHFNLIDFGYLYIMGLGLHSVIKIIFKVNYYVIHHWLGKFIKYVPYYIYLGVSIALFYFIPWPAVILLTVASYAYIPKHKHSELFFSFFVFFWSLPQCIGWFVIASDHRVIESLNVFDAFNLIPYCGYLVLLYTIQEVPSMKTEFWLCGMYSLLFAHDLLYRINIVMTVFLTEICLRMSYEVFRETHKLKIKD